MKFAEKYRELLKKRIDTPEEAITFDEPFIKETIKLFSDNIPEAIDFLVNECTEDEYSWISEIIDNIAGESMNMQLIQTYASLADKYPEETEKYNIRSFIRSSTAIVKLWQDDDDEDD